jgi:hypothetical protein
MKSPPYPAVAVNFRHFAMLFISIFTQVPESKRELADPTRFSAIIVSLCGVNKKVGVQR